MHFSILDNTYSNSLCDSQKEIEYLNHEQKSRYIDHALLEGKECYHLYNNEKDIQYLIHGGNFQVFYIYNSKNRHKIRNAHIALLKFNRGITYNDISHEEKLILNKQIINTIKYLTYRKVQYYLDSYSLNELKILCYLNHIPENYIINKKYKGNWALAYKLSISFSKEVFCHYFYNNTKSKLYGHKDVLRIIHEFI